MTDHDCDAVIVGSGPAGSAVAETLSAAGWSVIVLEKGRNHLLELEPPYGPIGHFSNDEVKCMLRHFLGPDPLVEPRTFRRTETEGDRLMVGHVNSLPCTVGGGGVHADSKLPRLREEDFHLRSALGPVDGADVVDWPVSYADLEPYYAEAERLVGVAGEETNPFAAWRSGPYPMPPGPDMYGAVVSMAAATRAGLHPYRAPTGANSVPYDGRPACVNCGFCGGYGCPIEAKGDPIALLRRALLTGRCEVRPESHVVDVVLDRSGRRATGVRYIDADGASVEVRARQVVLAAGAFETPRLLVRNGVANSSGLVGRNLMYHFQTFAVGAFPFRMHGMRGRSVTSAHDDHIVGDDAQRRSAREAGLPWIRGGLVEHGGAGQPIQEGIVYGPGAHHASAMRDSSLRERLWCSPCRARTSPNPRTASTSTRRCEMRWVFRQVASPTHRTATSLRRRLMLRRSSRECCATQAPNGPSPRRRHHREPMPSSHHWVSHPPATTSWGRVAWAPMRPRASSGPKGVSGTSRTCCARTRRCSPHQPVTTRR
ncbi:MAG: GMC family oxidoreductase [Actinomycetota bacterium]|nr:GMC family oxidoreductase [Actinomycetota bacterium]